MRAIIRAIVGWLTGGFLDRALGTVDHYIQAQTDRDRMKAQIITAHIENRASWMKAGGFWTLLLFALPTAVHYLAVVVYSMLWCSDCAFSKSWTIAALPAPMDEWQGYIILASIGALGLVGLRR